MSPNAAFITTPALTPGTPEWAECTPPFLSRALQIILRELEQLPQLAHDLQEHRIWDLFPESSSNWDDFCRNVMLVDPVFVDVLVSLARTARPSPALTAPPVDEVAEPALPDAGAANNDGVLTVDDAEAVAVDFMTLVEPTATTTSPADSTPSSAEMSGRILVDRVLVEEWLVLAVARVWRGAATTVAPGERERALRSLARIRDVAAAAGIDLRRVEVDDDGGRLVDLSAEDGEDAGVAWGLATAEREIRDLIARDARRPTKAKRARSAAARRRR